MSVVQTLIGNVKGPQGATGATGATGADGTAATIEVGTVTTTAYGNPAQVTNSGTSSAATFDFVIPQGKPGEATTTMGNLTLDSITASTASFPTPTVGDTGKIVFGKINKFFADVVSALNNKLNTSNVVNNFTTTDSGYALDARAGKTLNDSLSYTTIESGITTDLKLYKWGRVVFISFEAFKTTSQIPANTNFSSIPADYSPVFPVSFLDSLQKIRITIETDGYIQAKDVIAANSNIRGYATYISAS